MKAVPGREPVRSSQRFAERFENQLRNSENVPLIRSPKLSAGFLALLSLTAWFTFPSAASLRRLCSPVTLFP